MVKDRQIKPPFKPRLKNEIDLRFFDKVRFFLTVEVL